MIIEGLLKSMYEENNAVKSYIDRARDARMNGNEKVARKYEEIIKEERVHREEFTALYNELEGKLG